MKYLKKSNGKQSSSTKVIVHGYCVQIWEAPLCINRRDHGQWKVPCKCSKGIWELVICTCLAKTVEEESCMHQMESTMHIHICAWIWEKVPFRTMHKVSLQAKTSKLPKYAPSVFRTLSEHISGTEAAIEVQQSAIESSSSVLYNYH